MIINTHIGIGQVFRLIGQMILIGAWPAEDHI